jgi:hypothetical protein
VLQLAMAALRYDDLPAVVGEPLEQVANLHDGSVDALRDIIKAH